METVTFKTKGPRMIYVQRLGERIRFDGSGLFKTDNPKLIKALKRNRNTEVVSSKDDDSASAEPIMTHKEAHSDPRGMPTGEEQAAAARSTNERELTDAEREELENELTPATQEHDTLGEDDDERGGFNEPIDPDDHTRPVLDALAEREGIDPKKYGNKRLLADAINAKRNE